ncbi:MAG: DUF4162 domain-containing protein, partial [Methanosarcinales archaeon]|nr:DUF4162 domain-containing protein [Methanosarcinales archaeon]
SVGLDPVSRKALWDTIREVNRQGTTILITTHYMEEADLLCSRILIMHKGNIIVEGEPEELKGLIGERVIQITSTPGSYKSIIGRPDFPDSVSSRGINEKGLKITLKDEQALQQVINIFESSGETIINVESNRPSLEDVFIHFAEEEWH